MVPGRGRRSRLQAPGPCPFPPLCLPQSPPHSAPQLKRRPPPPPRTLSGAGTGPVPPIPAPTQSGEHRPLQTHLQRPPYSCRSVISAGVPTPARTELVERSPARQASGAGAFAARSPGVGEARGRGGAGARRSGGSGALSKRDRAGLRRPRPSARDAAPTPPGLRPPSQNSAPPGERGSGPPRHGRPFRLGSKRSMGPQDKATMGWQ